MSNKYVALTIGPIYQTAQKARRTREFWAASYVFSWIMKSVIQHLRTNGNVPVKSFILPYYPEQFETFDLKIGVGVWPDRLILSADGNEFHALQNAVNSTVEKLADETYKEFTRTEKAAYLKNQFEFVAPNTYVPIKNSFFKYFRLACLEIEERDLPAAGDSFVKKINYLLDHLELTAQIAPLEPDYMAYLLRAVHRSFFIKDAFHPRFKFESLIEVATSDLRPINPTAYEEIVKADFDQKDKNEEQDLLDRLTSHPDFRKEMSTRHRYIAIVNADGDGIGKLLGKLGDDEEAVQSFSEDLIAFGIEANQILAGDRHTENPQDYGYGAAPLYLGGDDLVFFAPVARRNNHTGQFETVFHLIQKIDQAFAQTFKKYKEKGVVPTLSYGVSISYYKYPLQEAMEESRRLLAQIKQDLPEYKDRNRINFKVLRHSGQHYGGIINKNDSNLYSQWFLMLNQNLKDHAGQEIVKKKSVKDKENYALIAGVAHKLDRMKDMLEVVLDRDTEKESRKGPDLYYQSLLDPLFLNQFSEKVHRNRAEKDRLSPFLEYLKDFIAISRLKTGKADLDLTYALLRFIHLINSKDEDDA
ncbi:MAG: type III-B CRISPR-associated protein Cas10/Cmr2 [Bacteroidia bacterium]